jgi:hypothetical protein
MNCLPHGGHSFFKAKKIKKILLLFSKHNEYI